MNERGRADDGAVFERDDHACVHCGRAGDGPDDLETYPVNDEAAGSARRETLVTVCRRCHDTLRGEPPDWRRRFEDEPSDGVLSLLREVTTTQGSAVADVADFAATTTGGVDADDGTERRRYLEDRRRVRLALAVVDRHLSAADRASVPFDDDVAMAFDAVRDEAGSLQSQLAEVVTLAETAIATAGRCHACLERVDAGREAGHPCPACGTPPRDASEWITDEGALSLAGLYGTVNERLQAASATTETLTKRTGQLAELVANRP